MAAQEPADRREKKAFKRSHLISCQILISLVLVLGNNTQTFLDITNLISFQQNAESLIGQKFREESASQHIVLFQ